jgi:hypothetical protein
LTELTLPLRAEAAESDLLRPHFGAGCPVVWEGASRDAPLSPAREGARRFFIN